MTLDETLRRLKTLYFDGREFSIRALARDDAPFALIGKRTTYTAYTRTGHPNEFWLLSSLTLKPIRIGLRYVPAIGRFVETG